MPREGILRCYAFPQTGPEQFNVAQSATILTMVVLGGIGTIWGPVIGAFVLVALPQAITFLQPPSSLVGPLQGLIFTLLVIVFLFMQPHGLVGARMAEAAH
jgi:branched-chain amino acid transport system permease protein